MEQFGISSDLIRGHIDTIILYSLVDSDKYAQQISDSIELCSNNEYKINQATLYSSLKRLESLKYVSSYMFDAKDGGRRKYFHLTDLGNDVIKNNVLDWSRSRQIIDKLIGCESNHSIERVVYVQSPKNPDANCQSINANSQNIPQQTSQIYLQENTNKNVQFENVRDLSGSQKNEDKDELNYKAILSTLKKYQINNPIIKEADDCVVQEDISSIKQEVIEQNVEDIEDFNQIIADSKMNNQNLVNVGKIDFGDLIEKSNDEGFKVKISSKDSATPTGYLKLNKIKFVSALTTFLFACMQLIILYFSFNGLQGVFTNNLPICFAIISIYPLVRLFFAGINDKYKVKFINGDSILTASIIIFNGLVIIFACSFLFELDFANTVAVINYIVIPILLLINALIYFVCKFLYSKSKTFSIK